MSGCQWEAEAVSGSVSNSTRIKNTKTLLLDLFFFSFWIAFWFTKTNLVVLNLLVMCGGWKSDLGDLWRYCQCGWHFVDVVASFAQSDLDAAYGGGVRVDILENTHSGSVFNPLCEDVLCCLTNSWFGAWRVNHSYPCEQIRSCTIIQSILVCVLIFHL